MGNESVPSQFGYKKNDTDHVQSWSIKFSASFWRQTVSERSSARVALATTSFWQITPTDRTLC